MRRALPLAYALFALAALAQASAAQQVAPACTDSSRACLIAAATAYLDGIVAHDGSRVPFAPDCRRTEQARVTASSEQELRESLALMPDMSGRDDTRFFVDEAAQTVITFTLLRVVGTNADPARKTYPSQSGGQPATVHLAERFRVVGGLIREIEAIFHLEAGTSEGTSGWPAAR